MDRCAPCETDALTGDGCCTLCERIVRRADCERCGASGRRRTFMDVIDKEPPPLSSLSREIERFRSQVPRDERGTAVPSEETSVLDRMGLTCEATRGVVRALWKHAHCEAEFERAIVREERTRTDRDRE